MSSDQVRHDTIHQMLLYNVKPSCIPDTLNEGVIIYPRPRGEVDLPRYRPIQLERILRHAHPMATHRFVAPLHTRACSVLARASQWLLKYQRAQDMPHGEARRNFLQQQENWRYIIYSLGFHVARRCPEDIPPSWLTNQMVPERQMHLLLRARLFDWYGHIATEVCDRLEASSESERIMGWEKCDLGYWADFGKDLQEEYAELARFTPRPRPRKTPRVSAAAEGAKNLGLRWDEVYDMIQDITKTGLLPSTDLAKLLRESDEEALKKRLFNDLCDLPLLIDRHQKFALRLFRTIICAMIDYLINRNSGRCIAREKRPNKWRMGWNASVLGRALLQTTEESAEDNVMAQFDEIIIDDVTFSMTETVSLGSASSPWAGFDDSDAYVRDSLRSIDLLSFKRVPFNAWHGSELTEHLGPR